MGPIFGTVQMLKPGRSTFGIELRLIQWYENSNAFSLECIFHDREGQRIHMTIPKTNIEKFKDRLIEGNVYAIIDFVIGLNVMKYKTTVENIGDAAMFDVMGAIMSHYRPLTREINGKLTKLMDLVLEDLEGNTITATLWENYAEQMIDFLETSPEAPVAVILQFCRPNIYMGEVRISSLFNVTKIVLDQKVIEIADFSFRYITTGKLRSTSISTLTSSSSRILNDEIRDDDFEPKTISQIMTDGKIGSSSSKSVVESKSGAVINKTIQQIMEDGEDEVLDVLPAEIEGISNKKGLFNIIVLPEHVNNYKGPFDVVKVACEDRIQSQCSEKLGTSSKSMKGKEQVDENANENIFSVN
ncbi:hypothetical protein C2S52_010119 [Perilla frutescens var. hirtella]|nr:hypothetical protein C2S52_010119 [Perilla frutescens var. hirtella]